jgi:MarR family 2-MHQ and catechol resistance regulon transcriptional repressor
VERRTHPDRRITLAALTPRGADLLREALPRHGDSLSELLGFLSDDEKSQLIELLTKLRRGLRESRKAAA